MWPSQSPTILLMEDQIYVFVDSMTDTWGTPTPLARKNTAQFFWDLAGVAGGKGVALRPTTPANSQKNWVVFFLVGGVGVPHVSVRHRRY
jgi:hypothetical protein